MSPPGACMLSLGNEVSLRTQAKNPEWVLEEVPLLWGVPVCDASSKHVHSSSSILRTLWPVIKHGVCLCLPLFSWDPGVVV